MHMQPLPMHMLRMQLLPMRPHACCTACTGAHRARFFGATGLLAVSIRGISSASSASVSAHWLSGRTYSRVGCGGVSRCWCWGGELSVCACMKIAGMKFHKQRSKACAKKNAQRTIANSSPIGGGGGGSSSVASAVSCLSCAFFLPALWVVAVREAKGVPL